LGVVTVPAIDDFIFIVTIIGIRASVFFAFILTPVPIPVLNVIRRNDEIRPGEKTLSRIFERTSLHRIDEPQGLA
jgi:hypothetical protein